MNRDSHSLKGKEATPYQPDPILTLSVLLDAILNTDGPPARFYGTLLPEYAPKLFVGKSSYVVPDMETLRSSNPELLECIRRAKEAVKKPINKHVLSKPLWDQLLIERSCYNVRIQTSASEGIHRIYLGPNIFVIPIYFATVAHLQFIGFNQRTSKFIFEMELEQIPGRTYDACLDDHVDAAFIGQTDWKNYLVELGLTQEAQRNVMDLGWVILKKPEGKDRNSPLSWIKLEVVPALVKLYIHERIYVFEWLARHYNEFGNIKEAFERTVNFQEGTLRDADLGGSRCDYLLRKLDEIIGG
ncbi:hypothetical protein MMC31_007364 [Peltigera leucophlebia]|nr:hypothetical protein [Peltigera leucophlebia]